MQFDEGVEAFLKVLDPTDNATGGGAAAAIAGAMAAALAAMVARLSIGKENMEPEVYYADKNEELTRLSRELLRGAQEDSAAFEAVQSAFRLPRGNDQEKAVRQQAIQDAWERATRVPLANAERCARSLELALDLEGRSNKNAASDLKCAWYLARAGLAGCLENVEINLPMIKQPEVRAELTDLTHKLKRSPERSADR